jgi:hypothetical protein
MDNLDIRTDSLYIAAHRLATSRCQLVYQESPHRQ